MSNQPSQVWCNKGVTLGNLNRYQEEIECYNITLKINPKYLIAWYNKAIKLANLDYLSQAIESLKKAKESNDQTTKYRNLHSLPALTLLLSSLMRYFQNDMFCEKKVT